MKRNVFWGLWAIAPLLLLVYVSFGVQTDESFVAFNIQNRFWMANWWKCIGVFFVVNWLFFLIHSLINKRFIWFVVLLILQIFAHPFYWWFNNRKST